MNPCTIAYWILGAQGIAMLIVIALLRKAPTATTIDGADQAAQRRMAGE